ncbi:MAG: NAD(P)/FAD-dependent oxidoreductase [Thermoanaerobaculia bacterium]
MEPIPIVGAWPAGLSAAITLARAGFPAVVYERAKTVGSRFQGDFEAIENWTSNDDALDELRAIGIDPEFEHATLHEAVLFDAWGRRRRVASRDAPFYLVRRGPDAGTLDRALEAQALREGVEIRYETEAPAACKGIVAAGPRRTDALDVGYVFETGMPDGLFAVMADRIAPKGYGYLLVSRGRGTLACCMFDRFREANGCLARTVEFFRCRAGLDMVNPRRFGGIGNFRWPSTSREGEALHVGEAAGFQDALWGFGIRMAIVSGHLAARAVVSGRSGEFDRLWRERLGGLLAASFANRSLYRRAGDLGYALLIRRLARADARDFLHRLYTPRWWKLLLGRLRPVR